MALHHLPGHNLRRLWCRGRGKPLVITSILTLTVPIFAHVLL